MIYPPINLVRKILCIIEFEKVFIVTGKVLCCTARGIIDHGNESAAYSLKAGDSLDLNLGRMNVQVGIIDYFEQLITGIETQHRFIRQYAAAFNYLFLLRAITCKNELNPIAVFGHIRRFDKNSMALFLAVPPCKQDNELVLIFRRFFGFLRLEHAHYSV